MLSNINNRKSKNKFTLVIIPGDKSETARSIQIGKLGIVFLFLSIFVVISTIIVLLFVYTPAGNIIPVSNDELENKYNKKIIEIQDKLNTLIKEIIILRQYNLQLRQALGEKINPNDTTLGVDIKKSLTINDFSGKIDKDIEVEEHNIKPETNSEFRNRKTEIYGTFTQIELPMFQPAFGLITREYNLDEGHLGIDIVNKVGTLIYAPAPGRVIFANWTFNYGNTLIIAHGNGYRTVYKHTKNLLISEGEFVNRGDPIAIMGNTGTESTGPHLHFEIWKDGNALNPRQFLLNTKN